MNILYGAATLLLGGGMLAFLQFLISRHDQKHDRLKGEAKWHANCSEAALSSFVQHSVTLLTSDGRSIAQKSYTHAVQPESEPVSE